MSGYIDAGDRVVTDGVREATHARAARPELVGKHGTVQTNDGWGRCLVAFDDGTSATLWNAKDLTREEPAA